MAKACPRCGGVLLLDWGELFCLNCGHRESPDTPDAEEKYRREKEITAAMNGHIVNIPKITYFAGFNYFQRM